MNKILKEIRQTIIEWYYNSGRDFPWRHTKDPYKIMIAEFMLHRTRAKQVVPVYNDFIKRYPDVHSLAQTDPDDIKDVTRHLGLHWRSKHFLESAKFILNRCNGQFPDRYDELRRIPGVGEYIAGAIMAVAFRKPCPVVDSNIARFINRFWGLKLSGEIRRKKEIVRIAEKLFDSDNPGEFLFAMVDFTTFICKPGNPGCKNCYLKDICNNCNSHQ